MVLVGTCRPWREAELEAVSPGVIVALGATAVLRLRPRGYDAAFAGPVDGLRLAAPYA